MATPHGPPRLARPFLRFPKRQRPEPEGAHCSPLGQRPDAAHAAAGQHRYVRLRRSAAVPEEVAEELHWLVLLSGEEIEHLDLGSPGIRTRPPPGASVCFSVPSYLG